MTANRGRTGRTRLLLAAVALAFVVIGAVRFIDIGDEQASDSVTAAGGEVCAGQDLLAFNRNTTIGSSDLAVETVAAESPRLVSGDLNATASSLSSDGSQIVFVVAAEGAYESSGPGSTSLFVADLEAPGRPRQFVGDEVSVFVDDPAWSPDGTRVAYVSIQTDGSAVLVTDAAGGQPETVLSSDRDADPGSIAWSPDGSKIAVARHVPPTGPDAAEYGKFEVVIVDLDGGENRNIGSFQDVHSLDWRPDATSLLISSFAAENGSVRLVDVNSGENQVVADSHTSFARWSPDGERVYFYERGEQQTEELPVTVDEDQFWRLAEGHIDDGALVRDRSLSDEDEYLYPYFDLAVGRSCDQ